MDLSLPDYKTFLRQQIPVDVKPRSTPGTPYPIHMDKNNNLLQQIQMSTTLLNNSIDYRQWWVCMDGMQNKWHMTYSQLLVAVCGERICQGRLLQHCTIFMVDATSETCI